MKRFIQRHSALVVSLGVTIAALAVAALCFALYYRCASVSLSADDLATLAELTGRGFTHSEITDIKAVPYAYSDGHGTDLFVFVREDANFKDNPDYDDFVRWQEQWPAALKNAPDFALPSDSLEQFGPYFYECLHAAGVEREHLISCGTHVQNIAVGREETTQYVYWMPLRDNYDGRSNLLIYTSLPGRTVEIQNKANTRF